MHYGHPVQNLRGPDRTPSLVDAPMSGEIFPPDEHGRIPDLYIYTAGAPSYISSGIFQPDIYGGFRPVNIQGVTTPYIGRLTSARYMLRSFVACSEIAPKFTLAFHYLGFVPVTAIRPVGYRPFAFGCVLLAGQPARFGIDCGAAARVERFRAVVLSIHSFFSSVQL